jgi:hypothetical protein
MPQDGSALGRSQRRRSALSVRPHEALTSPVDDQLGRVIDKNEGKPCIQRVLHRQFRRGTIKLLDYKRCETHR